MTRASFVLVGLALGVGHARPVLANQLGVEATVASAPASSRERPGPASGGEPRADPDIEATAEETAEETAEPAPAPDGARSGSASEVDPGAEPVGGSQARASAAEGASGPSRGVKVGAALAGVGAGLGIGAGVLTHVALNPPCQGIDDVLDCEVPTVSSLLGRRVMLSLGGTLAIGGAVLGGLGGGRLVRGLALDATDGARERRRKLVTGIGAGTLSLGLAQAVAGGVMVGVGVRGAVELVEPTDGSEEQDQRQREQINDRLRDVKVARSGLAMMLVSPTLIATGAAMLYRRKALRPRRVEVSFAASATDVGVVVRGRF